MGLEYHGEEDKFTPILNFDDSNNQGQPNFFALSGQGNFKGSPFVRFDLT